jgi:hypothetical protein
MKPLNTTKHTTRTPPQQTDTCVACGDRGAERGLCGECRAEMRAAERNSESLARRIFNAGRASPPRAPERAPAAPWGWRQQTVRRP